MDPVSPLGAQVAKRVEPLLIIAVLGGSFAGGGGSPPGSFVRVSLDVDATRRLWAAESAAGSAVGLSW